MCPLLYYGDVSEEAFGLLVEQTRPFGGRVVAYPQRGDLTHLEARVLIQLSACEREELRSGSC